MGGASTWSVHILMRDKAEESSINVQHNGAPFREGCHRVNSGPWCKSGPLGPRKDQKRNSFLAAAGPCAAERSAQEEFGGTIRLYPALCSIRNRVPFCVMRDRPGRVGLGHPPARVKSAFESGGLRAVHISFAFWLRMWAQLTSQKPTFPST